MSWQDTSEFSELNGVSSYALISEGMGLGSLASGVYAGLSGYVGESGTYQLQTIHFLTSSPGTGFRTSEISEIHTCNFPSDDRATTAMPDEAAVTDNGNGDPGSDGDTSANASSVTTTTTPYQPPADVYCGREIAISPRRAKLSIYGYTWGNKWQADVADLEYFFYRVRFCFSMQSWYVNRVLHGEGTVLA